MTARICVCRISSQCGVNKVASNERRVSIPSGSSLGGVSVVRASCSECKSVIIGRFDGRSSVVMRACDRVSCAVIAL